VTNDRRAVQKLFHHPERAEAAIKLVLSEKSVTDYELTARARRQADGRFIQRDTFYDRNRKLQGYSRRRAMSRSVSAWRRNCSKPRRRRKREPDQVGILASMSHEIRTR